MPSSSHMVRVPFYELQFLEEIGRGVGVVYRGMWQGDEVAIKVLSLQQLSPAEACGIHDEMAMMWRIRYQHVVNVLAISEEPTRCAIVMEYMSTGLLIMIPSARVAYCYRSDQVDNRYRLK